MLIDTLRECDGDTRDAAQMLLPSAPEPQHTASGGADEPCCSKNVDQTPRELSPTDILQEHGAKFKSEKPFELVVRRDKL